VISSDAGHSAAQNPLFGLDPQARLDYGYQAVAKLTPMAKALIVAAYGRPADRSYIAGTSNGGRHAMVAAARLPDAFDGVLAQAPGFNLPRAAAANMATVKHWERIAPTKVVNGQPDVESALPTADRALVARAILARCDALDGLADGLVHDTDACHAAFNLQRDVPTCSGARDGSCLSAEQKQALARAHAPSFTSNGTPVYSGFAFDPGLVQPGWAEWKFRSALGRQRNPVSVAFIMSSPPSDDLSMAVDASRSAAFAVSFDLDNEFPKLFATQGPYTESGISFMTPPGDMLFEPFMQHGGKLLVVHGVADPIFSSEDTAAWYRRLSQHHQGATSGFARYFQVPGMGHSRGGPATDQYDGLAALIDWVEGGQAPQRIVATARQAGNPGGANPDVPAQWQPQRSRPLCPYPSVARYTGGDTASAASFTCLP
jgi:dienelactone hydrolase